VLEKIEEELRLIKKENSHLKERLQELVKQIDIYKSEVVTSKDYERRKVEMKEE
jgi:hypothetical protein